MSTRLMLNLSLGAVALVLLASLSMVWTQSKPGQDIDLQVELAQTQQMIIQDLARQLDQLTAADNPQSVTQTRQMVGQTVLEFDRNLAALMFGGAFTRPDGTQVEISRVPDAGARKALDETARTWLETGVPLADLAAGEFSVFSAAGRQAVTRLKDNNVMMMQQMGTVATSLRDWEAGRRVLARYAAWGAGISGLLLLGLALARLHLRRRPAGPPGEGRPEAASRQQAVGMAAALTPAAEQARSPAPPPPAPAAAAFAAAVDFGSVSASVDQMSVDMNTIASSTDKMRLAIDSVGHAMQGMLYSLKEMAQDSAEGHKIVRGANNAASFTAEAAGTLVDSAREMSRVVGQVTQLAVRTRQIAAQIDAEAVHTGQTGEVFTSVVAGEVKGLAEQTSRATLEIENTISEIMATARQYEEAIGQIIKNIAAINKVSQNLGELMLAPPPKVVPGTPAAPPPALTPTPAATAPAPPVTEPVAAEPEPEPVAAPPVGAPDPFAAVEDPEEETVCETAAEVEDQAATEPEPEPEPEPGPEPAAAFSLEDDDEEPSLEDVAAETQAVIEDLGTEPEPAAKPSGTNANVFLLGKKKPAVPEPEAGPEAEAAPPPAAAQPDPVPAAEPETSGGSPNVIMLNKPKKAAAAKPPATDPTPPAEPEAKAEPEAETEPEAAAAPTATAGADDGEEVTNVFMLNMPKPAETPAEQEEEDLDDLIGGLDQDETAAPADDQTDSAPAADEADDDGAGEQEPVGQGAGRPNVFMLNKPK